MTLPDSSTADSTTQHSPLLQGERVTFTGVLASMTHARAAELVAEHGGVSMEHVSRQTTLLVVGEEGWPLEEDGQPSLKLQQAEKRQKEGHALRILNESDWLTWLGLTEHREEIRRLYTPAMLSSLLKVSVSTIRRWERAQLIRPVKRVFRLPYFDFQEVTSARRLAELLASGVSREKIEQSLKQLPSVLRGENRPLEQLELLYLDAQVVVRDKHGLVAPDSRQRLIDFEPPHAPESSVDAADVPTSTHSLRFPTTAGTLKIRNSHRVDNSIRSAKDWLTEGCRRYDAGEIHAAVEAFRSSLMSDPQQSEAHFHLAECLYRQDNPRGALERYYAAVEQDHDDLESWTQIGCVHQELGDPQSAIEAFKISLDIHAECPEAHFHLAEALHGLGLGSEALPHWRKYLEFDSRGPWADIARQHLEARNPGLSVVSFEE